MVRSLSMVLVGFAICWLFCGTHSSRAATDATEKEAPFPAAKIALVDMTVIYKKSKSFEAHREALKAKIGEAEATASKMNMELRDIDRKLKGLDRGSEESKELQGRLKQKSAEFERFRQESAREFQKEESKIYLKIYRLVEKEIENYAQAHQIDLVLRHNKEPILDGDEPAKVVQWMNRTVLYENKLDITDEIIAAMSELE